MSTAGTVLWLQTVLCWIQVQTLLGWKKYPQVSIDVLRLLFSLFFYWGTNYKPFRRTTFQGYKMVIHRFLVSVRVFLFTTYFSQAQKKRRCCHKQWSMILLLLIFNPSYTKLMCLTRSIYTIFNPMMARKLSCRHIQLSSKTHHPSLPRLGHPTHSLVNCVHPMWVV